MSEDREWMLRELLRKYIYHVERFEGGCFLTDGYRRSNPIFSDEEWIILQELADSE